MKNPRLWQLALAGYWLLLFAATHLPSDVPALPGDGADKLVHLTAFALLAALFAATWEWSAGQLMLRHLCWAWIAIALYAGLDEWTQNFVGRQASVWDWLADAVGAAAGLAIFARLAKRS